MSNKVKLRTEDSNKFGQTNVIPYAGEVQISKEGVIEVDQEVAQQVVNSDIGFTFVNEKGGNKDSVKKTVETIPPQTENSDKLPGTEAGETIPPQTNPDELKKELEEQITAIKSMNMQDLQKTAEAFPKEEWISLKKQELVDYLINKISQ